jgi:exopolyphosphatase/guanosine-5'-triphosphate,3'-diphosphate pyrophosphatase
MGRVAAVDCGTNSIRLLIADLEPGPPRPGHPRLHDVRREMRIVRLGQGVDATGRFAAEALERTRVALSDYAAAIRAADAGAVRMVATSAARDAANRDEFFDMVRATLATDAEVISGDEEARLSFTGAVGDLDPGAGPFVVTDVGGGSTEVVTGGWDGVTARVAAAISVDVGCVRLTERYLRSDPPTPDEVAGAEEFARDVVRRAFDAVPVEGARTWVGVAGTITTLSALEQGLTGYDAAATHLSRMALPRVHEIARLLVGSSKKQLAARPVIHPGRVDVIAGGALVVRALADELAERAAITELVISEHDILDGIALSLG